MLFNRENNVVQSVASQKRDIEDIKQSQVIGTDNLVVRHYTTELVQSVSIPAGTYAEYTAVFTYDNPPSNAFCNMTWNYGTDATSLFATEYTPAAYIGDSTARRYVFRFTAASGTITSVDIESHITCTDTGTLTLSRTL